MNSFLRQYRKQQSGAVEACWAHNPEVRRSKLRSANIFFVVFFLLLTGNLRPGILKIGASSKNDENFSASNVALLISNFKSVRKRAISLTKPKRMSVCRVRSWASSIIITLYDPRSGSDRNSLCSVPSVMYFIIVRSEINEENIVSHIHWYSWQ
jgi:hypothetical protein